MTTEGTTSAVANGGHNDDGSSRLYTLYFIRHAEALHNQLEKKAQSEALSLAVSQGHDPQSAYAKRVQEEARKAILEGDNIQDPPLSDAGKEEARNAKRSLEKLIATYNLPAVEEIWVSPLQRTLQTAATIFPPDADEASRPKIRVRKELEERQTGYSCDKHSSIADIRKRKTFKQFSLSRLKIALDEDDEEENVAVTSHHRLASETLWEGKELDSTANSNLHRSASAPPDIVVEDKSMLRERTKQLFGLLAETTSRNICVIAHKGYLRELERGPLGKEDAELFKNCEVRVYQLVLDIAGDGEVLTGNATSVLESKCEEGGDEGKPVRSLSVNERGSLAKLQKAEKVASSKDV